MAGPQQFNFWLNVNNLDNNIICNEIKIENLILNDLYKYYYKADANLNQVGIKFLNHTQ